MSVNMILRTKWLKVWRTGFSWKSIKDGVSISWISDCIPSIPFQAITYYPQKLHPRQARGLFSFRLCGNSRHSGSTSGDSLSQNLRPVNILWTKIEAWLGVEAPDKRIGSWIELHTPYLWLRSEFAFAQSQLVPLENCPNDWQSIRLLKACWQPLNQPVVRDKIQNTNRRIPSARNLIPNVV
jgi:hypothetical protein